MPRTPTGQVRRRPNGSWEITIPLGRDARDGSRKRRSYSLPPTATADEAEALRAKKLKAALAERGKVAKGTVTEMLEDYFVAMSDDWSPSTVRETRRLLDNYLIPRIGKRQASKLTTADIDGLYRELRARGGRGRDDDGKLVKRTLSAASVARIHRVLRPAFELAVRYDRITDNPCVRAWPGFVDEAEVHPPTPAEAQALLAAAEAVSKPFGVYALLSAVTGARRSEMIGLLRDVIDAEHGLVMFKRVVVIGPDGPVLRERTKTKRRRLSPVDTDTMDAVIEHMAAMETRAGHRLPRTAYLFSDDLDCTTPWRPDSQTRRFIKLRNTLGLDHVRLHDLRHFAGTQMLALGVDLRTAMDRLGHSQMATTQRYAHPVTEAQRAAADKLGALVRGGDTPSL